VLRKLSYLVQELSGKPFTPVPVALTGPTGDSHRVLVWACYARFAAGPRAMRVPVVAISMRGNESEKKSAFEAGAQAYIDKSDFSQALLWRTVSPLVVRP